MISLVLLLAVARAWEVNIESSNDATVLVNVVNHFGKPATLCVWDSPFEPVVDAFPADIFYIVNGSGAYPQYIGISAKKSPTSEDFVTIQPGQSMQARIDLFKGYSFPATGTYKVALHTFVQVYFGEFPQDTTPDLDKFETHEMVSNALDVEITRVNPAPVWGAPSQGVGGPNPLSGCSSSYASQINTAGANAITATQRSYNYLGSSCTSSLTTYVRWFGVCDSTRFTKVRNNLNSIANSLRATYPVNCTGSSCTANTYAYVYPSDSTHTVYVCGYFWRVPSTNCRLDSQPGTLIHEHSHFNNVASTQDIKYGVANCEALAKQTPNDAVRNADNFCFFTDTAGC
jgi:peptidyl-Lys metalloendopeptidase